MDKASAFHIVTLFVGVSNGYGFAWIGTVANNGFEDAVFWNGRHVKTEGVGFVAQVVNYVFAVDKSDFGFGVFSREQVERGFHCFGYGPLRWIFNYEYAQVSRGAIGEAMGGCR